MTDRERQSLCGLACKIYLLNCVFHLRGDFVLLSWNEVWSPLLLRNDDAWSRDVVRGNVNNLVAVVA